jgi:transcriptional regulator with XRE-family HTH domain
VATPRSPRHTAYGRAFRTIREQRGISQEALAHEADLDRTYVSGIERGERNPSLTNLLRLAEALDVPLSEVAIRAEATQNPS